MTRPRRIIAGLGIAGLALAAALLSSGGPAAAARLVVQIHNVSPKGGVVSLAVYNQADYDNDDHAVAARDVPAVTPLTTIVFDHLSPGVYAVKTFQDINRNGRFDTSELGLPLEPYGFSNDALPILGPPSFARTRFTVGPQETVIQITLSATDGIDVPVRAAARGETP